MESVIRVRKDGRFFVAEDLMTNAADQGLNEAEALSNLKTGLEERSRILKKLG